MGRRNKKAPKKGLAELSELREDYHPFFADDPIKEGALAFFINTGGFIDWDDWPEAPFREETYGEDKNSFYIQSRCFYDLSLCYKYFFEIQQAIKELYGIGSEECFLYLDRIKDAMWLATGDLLAYWHIDDKRKRLSQKGGKKPKRLPGILLAVKKMIQDPTVKSFTAQHLWDLFEKRHNREENAIEVNSFKIFFSGENPDTEGELFQLSSDGEKSRPIRRSAFGGYVAEVKRTLK